MTDLLDTIKEELLCPYPVADEDGRGLVWCGDAVQEAASPAGQLEQPGAEPERDPSSYTPQHLAEKILTS